MHIKKRFAFIIGSLFLMIAMFGCKSKSSLNNTLAGSNLDGPITDFESLEDAFNDPIAKFALKATEKAIEQDDSIYSFDMSVEGNRIIYEIHMKEDVGNQQSYYENYLEKEKGNLFSELRKDIDLDCDYEVEYIIYNADYSKACDVVLYEGQPSEKEKMEALKQEYEEEKKKEEKNVDNGETVQHYYEDVIGPWYLDAVEDAIMESNQSTFTDIEIECVDNYVTFSYYFAKDMGDVQANVETNMTDAEKEKILSDIKLPSGVTATVTIKYIYYNPDGSVAAEVEFEG